MQEEVLSPPLEQINTLGEDDIADWMRLNDDFAKHLDVARHLHALVTDHPDFEVLAEPTRSFYYFRYVPNGLSERHEEPNVQELLDRLNREIVEFVRHRGSTEVTTIDVWGRTAIRLSIVPHLSNDIDATFETIAGCGRLLNKTLVGKRHEDMEAQYV